ncbi:hypothetical protein [Olivibacter domesticus]|uniref:Uncharacterized protein n=1 Tax=Olivibacter domesticus TaxID=407022 RepID=A0A1H7LU46_OLID1|nr:hypothetical protein [Olivibacter domesticus]SEL02432.1 hypothetical protein SAMN05661044_01770 [Olivibacter domesticus]
MPNFYYLNEEPQPSGVHEIHADGCKFLPVRRVYLGYYANSEDATRNAKQFYEDVSVCEHCVTDVEFALPK